MKIVLIVGTRPNFVKIAPLLREMRKNPAIESRLVHTGQHYDAEMSDSFFSELKVPAPDFNLGVGSSSATSQTAEIMKALEPILAAEKPELVVVVGDVNSTLAGALTAVKLGIAVAHVEAGLRSFDRTMPEEINRLVTDAVSTLLFVSEPSGVVNLRKEGIAEDHFFFVGNVMIDTLRQSLPAARRSPVLVNLRLADGLGRPPRTPYAVLTLHRQGLVDNLDLFRQVWEAVECVGREVPIIFPVHPRTRKRLQDAGIETRQNGGSSNGCPGIRMVAPLPYLEFLRLESAAAVVLTDSGGIQEETTVLGVPCLTLRENTERPITVTQGTNTIAGLNPQRIQSEARRILSASTKPTRLPPLWDGHAAERIVKVLCERFAVDVGSAQRMATADAAVAAASFGVS